MSMACQAALTKRGVAVVIVPANISEASAEAGLPFVPRQTHPDILPSQSELRQIVDLISQHQKLVFMLVQDVKMHMISSWLLQRS